VTAAQGTSRALTEDDRRTLERGRHLTEMPPTMKAYADYAGVEDDDLAAALAVAGEGRLLVAEHRQIIMRLVREDGHA